MSHWYQGYYYSRPNVKHYRGDKQGEFPGLHKNYPGQPSIKHKLTWQRRIIFGHSQWRQAAKKICGCQSFKRT